MRHYEGTGRKKMLTDVPASERARREFSTGELCKLMQGKELREGKSFHIMTAGNIDYISNVLWLIKLYGRLKRVNICSWAIAGADLLLMREQCQEGTIERIDVLHDADFAIQRNMDYAIIMKMRGEGYIHNIIRSRMHNKSIMVETCTGEKFVILTSANCTFNPRVEIQTISINALLYDQYDRAIQFIADREMEISTSRQYPKLNSYEDHTAFSF